MNAGKGEVPKMTTRQWRDSIKSFLGAHVAPEKTEQLKETKNEIENKVKKILKLIKDEGEEGSSIEISDRESELVDHIKDFHKQYQSLYELHHHLTAKLKENFYSQEGQDGYLSTRSSSDSDSDHSYHSSKEKDSENGKQGNELQKEDESIKQELKAANDQVADLKQRLADAYREKELLRADTDKALSSIDELKNFSEDLQAKADQSKDEKLTLSVENGAPKEELESMTVTQRSNNSEAELSALKMIREEFEHEASARIKSLEAWVNDLQSEVDSLHAQRSDLEEQIKCKSDETKQLREENLVLLKGPTDLQDQVFEWERKLKEKGGEISALHEELEDKKKEAAVQINDLLLELDSLRTKESKLQLQIEEKNQDASDYEKKIKNLYLEKDHLVVQVHDLQVELDSLCSQKSQLELQIAGEKQEATGRQTQVENINMELTNKVADQKRLLEDQEDRIRKLTEEYKQLEDLCQESQENLQVAQKKVEEMGEVYQRNIDSKDEMIHMLQRMAEELKKEVETGREEVTTLKTELSNLQERLHSTESDKTDANVEKERLLRAKSETTEIMRRIQREQQGEIARLQDEINIIEVKLRLSNRKLHVTEQLLTEKEESYRKKEEQFRQECKEHEEQNAKLSNEIATAQRDLMEIRNTLEKMSNSFSGFEVVFQKFQEDDSSNWSRIAEVSGALRIAKTWVTDRNNKKEELEGTISNLVEQLKDKHEQEMELKERVGQLEVKLHGAEEEKEKLMMIEKKARELEKRLKGKEDEVLCMKEEKREAIRQLCIWTEYKIDHLKALLSKTKK